MTTCNVEEPGLGDIGVSQGIRKMTNSVHDINNGAKHEKVSGAPFYRRFPNAVVRDQRIAAETLIVLAFRSTFADARGAYGLNERRLGRIVRGRGFGRNVIRRAIDQAKELGYLDRPDNAKAVRKPDGRFNFAVDHLTLPYCADDEGRVVMRDWFDGSLTLNEAAAFLYLRAGTGKGPRVYANEVALRFGWSRPMAAAALAGLLCLNRITRHQARRAAGVFAGVTYAAAPTPLEAGLPAAAVKKRGNGAGGIGSRGNDEQGDSRSVPLNEGNPGHAASASREVVARAGTRSDDPQDRGGGPDDDLVRQLQDWDLTGALDPKLLTEKGLEPLRQALREHGVVVLEVVRPVLMRELMGDPDHTAEAPLATEPKIRSWKYILREGSSPLADELRRRQMQENGWRPGDLAGDWRKARLEPPF
jgi:hypothetical protein